MTKPRITAAARMQRLLAILQWASTHTEGVAVDDLCQRFKLSRAEVARELDLASMIGADSPHYDEMPFEVFIEDGLVFVRLFSFRRPMRITPVEGLALVAAADVLIDRSPGDPGPLERALAKLADLLGIEPGAAVDVDLDPDGGDIGGQLADAMARDRQVTFTYWSYGRDSVATRRVDPWSTYLHDGAWYLVGWDRDAAGQRTFRFDRLEDLEALDEARSTSAPSGLGPDPALHDDAPRVVLDLGPAARWVAEAHPTIEATQLDDGRLRVTMGVAGAKWLERLLLRLGPDASVVEIDERVGGPDIAAQAASRVLSRYRGGD